MNEHYEITYTDKHSGEQRVHTFRGSQGEARSWGTTLSQNNNNTPTTVESVNAYTGERKNIGGVGKQK